MREWVLKASPIVFWLCCLVLTWLLLIEVVPKTGNWPYWDKVYHLVAFAGVTILGFLSYRNKLWLALALTAYGGLMEVLQGLLTTTRMPSMLDWLADVVGIVLAWMLTLFVTRILKKGMT